MKVESLFSVWITKPWVIRQYKGTATATLIELLTSASENIENVGLIAEDTKHLSFYVYHTFSLPGQVCAPKPYCHSLQAEARASLGTYHLKWFT